MSNEAPSVVTGLNIAASPTGRACRPDTLRKWEQRYAIIRPHRTPADSAGTVRPTSRGSSGCAIASRRGTGSARPPRCSARRARRRGRGRGCLRAALYEAVVEGRFAEIEPLLDQTFALPRLETALRDVVEPVLKAVGDAWERGDVTVAQEHFVSTAIRARLERLLADSRGAIRGVAVLACVPGERHELGL